MGDLSFSEPGSLCMECNDALYEIPAEDRVYTVVYRSRYLFDCVDDGIVR